MKHNANSAIDELMLCFHGRYITTVFHHKYGSRKITSKTNKEKLHIAIAL